MWLLQIAHEMDMIGHLEKTSIDVLPSKNQALCKYSTHVSNHYLSLNTVNTLIIIKSRENRGMHSTLYAFKFCF